MNMPTQFPTMQSMVSTARFCQHEYLASHGTWRIASSLENTSFSIFLCLYWKALLFCSMFEVWSLSPLSINFQLITFCNGAVTSSSNNRICIWLAQGSKNFMYGLIHFQAGINYLFKIWCTVVTFLLYVPYWGSVSILCFHRSLMDRLIAASIKFEGIILVTLK